MSAAHHHLHNMDPTYAPPVIHAPSPSTSLTTEYAPDATSLSDQELTDEEFSRKCEEMIGLGQRTAESTMILLPKPQTAAEEKSTMPLSFRVGNGQLIEWKIEICSQ